MSKKQNHPHQGIADAIRRVSHAIYQDHEENRDHLRTVHLEVSAGRVTVLATDGHRISCVSSAQPADFPVGTYTIAAEPKKTAKIKPASVADFVGDSGGLKFPDWERSVPAKFAYSATVKRSDLLSAVEACKRIIDRASKISEAEHKHTAHSLDVAVSLRSMDLVCESLREDVAAHEKARARVATAKAKRDEHSSAGPKSDQAVRLTFGQDGIALEARGHYACIGGRAYEVATETQRIPLSWRNGACRDTIGIDVRYLAEAVRAATSEEITIEAIDAYSPIRVSGTDSWELIMPMRLR